jgi:hypothetical protein
LEFDSAPSKELTKGRLRELILQEIAFYRNIKKRKIILPSFKNNYGNGAAGGGRIEGTQSPHGGGGTT